MPTFEMLANAKSSLVAGSLNIRQPQDVYNLLSHPHPTSVPEASVCISYHRVLKHKHYS